MPNIHYGPAKEIYRYLLSHSGAPFESGVLTVIAGLQASCYSSLRVLLSRRSVHRRICISYHSQPQQFSHIPPDIPCAEFHNLAIFETSEPVSGIYFHRQSTQTNVPRNGRFIATINPSAPLHCTYWPRTGQKKATMPRTLCRPLTD